MTLFPPGKSFPPALSLFRSAICYHLTIFFPSSALRRDIDRHFEIKAPMEQRRFPAKATGTTKPSQTTRRRMSCLWCPKPLTSTIVLLDLALPDEIVTACAGWLTPARALCHRLFPLDIAVNRLYTLSAYDRLSTALTVAQACGVQRLCNHYAALLAPFPARTPLAKVTAVWPRSRSMPASLPVHRMSSMIKRRTSLMRWV